MSAGASAADVRSILSIPGPSGSPTPGGLATPGGSNTTALTTSSSTLKARKAKPDGISRELFALIGTSVPTLNAQLAKPKFKPKPKNLSGGGKAQRWEWREFTNPARKDNLRLGHWVKASQDAQADYPFAKYNIQPQSYTYSQDEYTNLLEEEGWTKEETDYLFNIVQEYDLRFYVIADRYIFPGGPPRSVEDLKDRYYGVCRRLIRNRPWPGDEAGKQQALAAVQYDKEREMNRKAYITSLENRTAEEIIEEEALFLELKRLEQSERNFARDRDELVRIFEGIESGLPSISAQSAQDEEEYALIIGDGKNANKKRKGGAMDVDSPVSSGPGMGTAGVPPTPVKKVRSAKEIAQDALHCIHRTDVGNSSAAATKAAHQPVFLRSYKIPSPRTSHHQRVAQALSELGLRHDRLVMPTFENVQQLEQLLSAAGALVETKKVVDRVDHEIRVLKARLAEKEGTIGNEEGDGGDQKPDAADENDADDLDADADGETDRAVSQAPSTKSSIRKGIKRSGSVSSVGSSTTTATRAPSRKRQRS
ncbi:SWC4 [Sanghuangporus weigelae]